ncbi:MAG: hypothetical protein ACON4Z_11605 [Planctomycetota bacterium]
MSRRRWTALALAACLTLPSCFTMTLWGFEPDAEQDRWTGETERTMTYDDETEWSWELLGVRLLGTPFALALDCLTAPVQAWWFGDDEPGERSRRDRGYHVDQRR